MKIKFSNSDLEKEFKLQLHAIRFLGNHFDKGNEFLFKDLAVRLRVIFHSTDRSHGLYNSLRLTEHELFDSAWDIENQVGNVCKAPIYLKFSRLIPSTFHPELLQVFTKIPFKDWWKEKAFIIDKDNKKYSRSDIILSVANTDGGAHVDISLDEKYYNISRGEGSGWSSKNINGIIENLNPVPSLVRQIAHETLQTFGKTFL